MDEHTEDTFSNRDEPIPIVRVSGNNGPSSDSDSKRVRLKTLLKDKVQDTGLSLGNTSSSLQDRLFTKLLQQVIPVEDIGNNVDDGPDKRSTKYVDRPGFSLPLMTNNFRRFNSRIGVVFVFQTRLIRLLTWKVPSQTLSLLAVYTFVCLDPYLLSALPLVIVLLFVMVPAFLVRHPPSAATPATHSSYQMNGPPLAPARIIKPASEMSKDFFRNMRDLQNSMDDFSTLHDLILSIVTPYTNFADEPLSSTVFLLLFITACTLFVSSHLLPWRFIALVLGWMAIILNHPTIKDLVITNHRQHLRPYEIRAQSWLDSWISRDIILDAPPETHEVEIFELQRRTGGQAGEWEAWLFSPSPYDPLSPQRLSGDMPKGTRFFEDVAAPGGWEWADKMWVLDLGSQEWVEEGLMQRVSVEVVGERWVLDLLETDEPIAGNRKGKTKAKQVIEGEGPERMGQWRRRRWVRTVKRKPVHGKAATTVANK